MSNDDDVQKLILDRLDKMDDRLMNLEKKVNWAMGFFAAVSAGATFISTKIYTILFGAP